MGLREIIGRSHGGTPSEWSFVSKFLREQYIDNQRETARRAAAQKRDAFYEGKGDEVIAKLIDAAFEDPHTRKLRKAMIPWGKHNNVIRRVSSELATVYNQAARRRVAGDGETYRRFVDLVNLDAAMRELDEKLVYHEDVWLQYRVRKDEATPVIDVVSPAMFWAVADPTDKTRLVAIILDQKDPQAPTWAPAYRVWCADETFALDGKGEFITATYESNPLGRMPGVLASTRSPTFKGQLLADFPAADLTAAHEAIWFINVLLVKETKSANNQTYVTGDTSAAVMGQVADTEREAILPEGVTLQAVDRGMDLDQFITTANYILESAAANHGLPPSVLHQRDAASGAEIHLRRIPIRELREKRIPIMRRIEREIAEIQSVVNARELPAYRFSAEGWGIDFGEVQQPLTEAEQDAVFEQRRRLGLTDTLEELRKRNPDLQNDAEAMKLLAGHVAVETKRVELMKSLMALNGSTGSAAGEPTPRENGAAGPVAAEASE